MLYVLLWVAFYPLIHATTCSNCVYHGKQCPIHLEGSCSHRTYEKGDHFGLLAGIGGLLAYSPRLCIPYVAIIQFGSVLYFFVYTGIILLFFYVLFFHTGCPHCIQTKCPLNPEFSS
jgi:hypothetical protein